MKFEIGQILEIWYTYKIVGFDKETNDIIAVRYIKSRDEFSSIEHWLDPAHVEQSLNNK